MSFHILHIHSHGAYLQKVRGRLYYSDKEKSKSLPIENMRAIIIAARGVLISSQLTSSLLEQDCIILHCCSKYKPIGITVGLSRTITKEAFYRQIGSSNKLKEKIWKDILFHKTTHQSEVLELLDYSPNPLKDTLVFKEQNEAHIARVYFRHYFKKIKADKQTRAQKKSGWLNAHLNYGYAVLEALVHRSVVIHGLIPQLGVFHKPRYRSFPLVYDLMEAYRPVVDGLTYKYLEQNKLDLKGDEDLNLSHFSKFIGNTLRDFRLPYKSHSIKLLDSIDMMVRSLSNVFEHNDVERLWLPELSWRHFSKIKTYG